MTRASMLSIVEGPRLGNEVTASILADHESFLIGAVEVVPATKTVRRDGRETVVEPRVMQVLVALADAAGAVVSRDHLVTTCWDGRIVGDDAINRVMSRLRRLAHEVGHDSFVIETVTKVGYRLRLADGAAAASDAPAKGSRIDRRTVIGTVAVIPLALGGTWWWSRGDRKYTPPPHAKLMFDQAMLAFNQNTREGQSQAVGILRKLVQDYPNYADAWGGLGMTYAVVSHFRTQVESAVLQQRASSAGRRALLLDPDNGFGVLALAGARPNLGNWLRSERELRAALARDPDNVPILSGLNYMMMSVGRIDAALGFNQRWRSSSCLLQGSCSAG